MNAKVGSLRVMAVPDYYANMNHNRINPFLLLSVLLATVIAMSIEDESGDDESGDDADPELDELLHKITHMKTECDVFMCPSLIKEETKQGYGLGLFTGKMLFAGQNIHWDGEVLLPFYDSATIDANHPPLREYLWSGNLLPELAFVSSADRNALWYSPGLSAVAPCSSTNFNLRLSGPGAFAGAFHSSSRSNLLEDDDTPPRTDPKAGSYSYHHALSYEAVRHIMPGEELVLEVRIVLQSTIDMI